jgi:hypothetical protein
MAKFKDCLGSGTARLQVGFLRGARGALFCYFTIYPNQLFLSEHKQESSGVMWGGEIYGTLVTEVKR